MSMAKSLARAIILRGHGHHTRAILLAGQVENYHYRYIFALRKIVLASTPLAFSAYGHTFLVSGLGLEPDGQA